MRANIDTGAIIAPISALSRSIDLGQELFASWRYHPDGVERRVSSSIGALSTVRSDRGAELAAAARGRRGLGAYALRHPLRDRAGLREIFFKQCQNGILPVKADRGGDWRIADAVAAAPGPG
jgi:hypothetical protein